jgi:hypothetical protein
MLAELCPLEQVGEAADTLGARIQLAQGPLQIFEGRLGWASRDASGGERALHPRVCRDDRAPQVWLRPKVVQRLVERERHRLLGATAPGARSTLCALAREQQHHDSAGEHEHDRHLVPAHTCVSAVLRRLR